MHKTKLEIYIDALKIIAKNDSLKTSNVSEELKISSSEGKKCLSFLLNQSLIDKRKLSNNRVVYSIAQRGIKVLIHFNEQKQLPINKEINVS